MIQLRSAPRAAVIPMASFFKWIFPAILLISFTGLVRAQVQTPEDKYLALMQMVDRADAMSEKGQTNSAKAKYAEAQTALSDFRKNYPNWNTKVVTFRMNYVAERITTLSKTNAPVVESTEKPEGTPVEKGTPKAASKSATSVPGVTVKLLEPGAEPRQALRLHPKAGDKHASTMTMKLTMSMGPAGEMKIPEMKIPIDVTVKNVSPEGDITYEMVIGQASMAEGGAADPAAAMMKDSMGKIGGQTATTTITSRGLTKAAKMNVPKDANPQTRQAAEQMQESLNTVVFMLPEEAIGPGAKWQIKQTIKQQNMTISQTTGFELVSVEGDVVKVKSNISQSAANQKIESPAAPGMKMDLNKMTGTGSGTLTYNLGQIMPTQGNSDMQTDISMGMNMGGQKQNMEMKATLSMTVESK